MIAALAQEIWLTVNKENADSIAFYQRLGFVIAEAIVTDIGKGFVMDDHRNGEEGGLTRPVRKLC